MSWLRLYCLDQTSILTSYSGSVSFMPSIVSREWVYTEEGPDPCTLKYVARGKESKMIGGRLVKGRWWMEWIHIHTDHINWGGERITWHPTEPVWFRRGSEPWTLARLAKKRGRKSRQERAAVDTRVYPDVTCLNQFGEPC